MAASRSAKLYRVSLQTALLKCQNKTSRLGFLRGLPSMHSCTRWTHPVCSYHNVSQVASSAERIGSVHVVDMRSDTVTRPTAAMREAMASAEVGDDVFGEDPTVNALQERVAEYLGMERALFVPTGTMGNLLAILSHCDGRGLETILGDKSHIYLYEQGGVAQVGGIHPRTVRNHADGTYDLEELEHCIRPRDDPHQPWTKLVCVENTQNYCGGKVIPLEFLAQLRCRCDHHGLNLHMDGARLLNAAVALEILPSVILKHVHSVNLCFSKGLGAPVGSIVAGNGDFIKRCRRLRKLLGGGWRQAGVMAAAASVALDDVEVRLSRDHQHAKQIATALKAHGRGLVDVDLNGVHSNIVMINVIKEGLHAEQLSRRFEQITDEEALTLGGPVTVRMLPFSPKLLRFVTHSDLHDDDVAIAIEKLEYVLQELSSK